MRSRFCCAASLFAVSLPLTATAQASHSALWPTASLGAGVAAQQGTGPGFNLLGTLEFGGTRTPLRFRLDGQFTQWTHSSANRAVAVTANIAAELRPTGVRPYFVAGGGGYAQTGTGLHPGWNVGLGLVVPIRGHELLFESRFHEWQRPDATGSTAGIRNWAPLTVRIRF